MQDRVELWNTDPEAAFLAWRQSALSNSGKRFAANSIRQSASQFGRFVRWVHKAETTLRDVDGRSIALFIEELNGASSARRTVHAYLAVVESVMDHLVSIGLRGSNPVHSARSFLDKRTPLQARAVRLPPANFPDVLRRYLTSIATSDDVPADALQYAAAVALLLGCGLTKSELLKLSPGDLTWSDDHSSCTATARGDPRVRQRQVPVPSWVVSLLKRRLESISKLNASSVQPIFSFHEALLYRWARDVGRLCGAQVEGSSAQMLRNLHIARLIQNGVAPGEIARRAGWRNQSESSSFRKGALRAV